MKNHPTEHLNGPARSRSAAALAGRIAATGAAAAVLGLAGLASPAGAHVSPDRTEVPAGGYTDIKLGVGHGCEVSPTTKLEVQIPEEILNVTPYVVPGWTVEVTTQTLDTPAEGSHGEQITERDSVVTWVAQAGNELPDGQKMQFGLSFQVPDIEGTSLHFPTIQTCEEGATNWIEIPVEGEAEPDEPAPTVMVVAGDGGGHGTTSDDSAEGDDGSAEGESAGGGTTTSATSGSGSSDEADDDADDDDGSSNALAIAGLVAGLGGLGLGGAAFARSRS